MNTSPNNDGPVIFISLFKSGTWFLRKIIMELTGLDFTEPKNVTPPEYTNPDKLFTPPPGTFYSWHLVPTPEIVAKLRQMKARPVLLIRNIHALTVSGYHHFRGNIDAEIGRGTGADHFFQSRTQEQGLSTFIQGVITPDFGWEGMGPQLVHLELMFKLAAEYPCFLTSYERLLNHKKDEIKKLADFLKLTPDTKKIQRISEQSDFAKMKKISTSANGKPEPSSHFRKGTTDSYLHELHPTHYQQIYEIMHQASPELPRLAEQNGFPDIVQAATNWPLKLENLEVPADFYLQQDLLMAGASTSLPTLPEKSIRKVALAPANLYTLVARRKLQQIDIEPAIYDKKTANFLFPCRIKPYEDLTPSDYDQVLVMSPKFGKEIRDDILNATPEKQQKQSAQRITLLKYDKKNNNNRLLTAPELVYEAEIHADAAAVNRLQSTLETNKPLLIFWGPDYSDMADKIELSREVTGSQTLWIRADGKPAETIPAGTHTASPSEALTCLRHNFDPNQLTFFILHDNRYFTLPLFLKKIFPGARVISYVYNWLNLFCPYLHKDKIATHNHWHDKFTDSEYLGVRSIIEGTAVDGIIYKDGGEDFYLLAHTPTSKLFLPPQQRKENYQPPPHLPVSPTRPKLLFVGTLFPATTVINEDFLTDVFQDMYLLKIFKRLTVGGLHIDAYDYHSSEQVLNEYRNYFAMNDKVHIYRGKTLKKLLPEIAGQYQWGTMLYDADYEMIKEHAKITLPAKLFTYLSLGIPILVSAELSFAAEYVRQHKIGIIINKDDLDRVADIVTKADYPQLIQNVLAFRDRHNFDQTRPYLAEFIKKTTSAVSKILSFDNHQTNNTPAN